jgi:ankyrin repeat protein
MIMSVESKAVEGMGGSICEKMQAFGYLGNVRGVCYGLSAAAAAEAALLGNKAWAHFNHCLERIYAIPLETFEKKLEGDADRVKIQVFFDRIELLQQAYRHTALFGGCDLHVLPVWPLRPGQSAGNTIPFSYPCYVYEKKEFSDRNGEEKEEVRAEKSRKLFCLLAPGESREVKKINTYSQNLLADLDLQQISYQRLDTHAAGQFGIFLQEMIPKEQGLEVAPLLRSHTMEENQNCLAKTDNFVGVYTEDDLQKYFTQLAQHATERVVLMLKNSTHRNTVIYDVQQKKWLYVDLKVLPIQYIAKSEEIAKRVLLSFSRNGFATMGTEVMVLAHTGEKKPRPDLAMWKESLSNTFTVFPEEPDPEDPDLIDLVDLVDSDGASMLYLAAQDGCLATVHALLKKGADPNKAQNTGITPLAFAAAKGHAAVVKLLLAPPYHADVHTAGGLQGFTPLHRAVLYDDPATVQVLLAAGARADAMSHAGITPLLLAVKKGSVTLVEILLDALLPENLTAVDQAGPDGGAPLFIAVEKGHVELVKLLLAYHADVNQKAIQGGITPLEIAVKNGHAAVVKLLLAEKGLKLSRNAKNSLLYMAAKNGHAGVVKCLLSAGSTTYFRGEDGLNAVEVAQQNGYVSTARYIQKYMLIKALSRYKRKGDTEKPITATAFFPARSFHGLSAEKKKAVEVFLCALKKKALVEDVFLPVMKTIKADGVLREMFEHACAHSLFPDGVQWAGTGFSAFAGSAAGRRSLQVLARNSNEVISLSHGVYLSGERELRGDTKPAPSS